jgi:hypothetical protein
MDEPAGDPPGRFLFRFGLAVAVPLAVVSLAYSLWWMSDRLSYIGPLDRAAFGWVVVIPLWISAPIAAGFSWRPLPRRATVLAAVVVGSAIGPVAATLFWRAVAYPDCPYGAFRTPGDWIMPSLTLGLVVGGGVAVSGLLASKIVREGHPWRAFAVGAGTEVAMVAAAILVSGVMLMGPGCQRPPV